MKSEVDGGDIGEIGLLMGEVFHQFQKLDSWTRKMLITSLSWTRWTDVAAFVFIALKLELSRMK